MARFTESEETRADEFVADQVATITERIRAELPGVVAVILVGSFGRGEGGVEMTSDGLRAVNDYDVAVIGRGAVDREEIGALGRGLAGELNVDFVDIGVIDQESLASLGPTIFNFDLRNGSRVLFAEPTFEYAIPALHPGDMPTWEALQLVFNRMAGCMSAVKLASDRSSLWIPSSRFVNNQVIKAVVGAVDGLLTIEGEYHQLCSVRRESLNSMLPLLGDHPSLWRELADRAYREKLKPGSVPGWNPSDDLIPALEMLRAVFMVVIERELDQRVSSPAEGVAGWLRQRRTGWRSRLLAPVFPAFGVSPSDAAFGSVALVAMSAPGVTGMTHSESMQARRIMARFHPTIMLAQGSGSWERMRQLSVDLWEQTCHG